MGLLLGSRSSRSLFPTVSPSAGPAHPASVYPHFSAPPTTPGHGPSPGQLLSQPCIAPSSQRWECHGHYSQDGLQTPPQVHAVLSPRRCLPSPRAGGAHFQVLRVHNAENGPWPPPTPAQVPSRTTADTSALTVALPCIKAASRPFGSWLLGTSCP